MHPAPSVILFTTLSGLGFGLLAFLGIGQPPVTGWVAFVFYLIAYGLAVGGLLASTFHLGNRKNAIKAFSQWRTSWLSREAWLSTFRWMQKSQGLWPLGKHEPVILDYLEKHYGPRGFGRRKPLPDHLLPRR